MDTPLPPDPYAALGVPKDADTATIKSRYRKLVLTCHPDKFTDPDVKIQKQEEFHKIQQAYELIGDDESRGKYDAQVKLEKLRTTVKNGMFSKGGAFANVSRQATAASYETRTAAPAGDYFPPNTSTRSYDDRKPTRGAYDDDFHDDKYYSSKYDTYEAVPRQTSRSSRPDKEPIRTTMPDRTRSNVNKTRDKEERRDRSGKYRSDEDEKVRYEEEYERRKQNEKASRLAEEARLAAEALRRKEQETRRKEDEYARRKEEDRRRSYEDKKEPRRQRSDDKDFKEPRRQRSDDNTRYDKYDRSRKVAEDVSEAVRYIHRSKVEGEPRASPSRTTSSREVRDPYDSRESRSSRRSPRRSSARPRDRERERGIEIVDWEDDRAPPSFKHSKSSPADIHLPPRMTPQRSQTEYMETTPSPSFRRSETMPSPTAPSSSRKPTVVRPSGLRSSTEYAAPREQDPAYPTIPPARTASNTIKYFYPANGGGVPLRAEEVGVANGRRTVLHEPSRRQRSPSPISRPPIGPNRPSETSRRTTSSIPPPPLGKYSGNTAPLFNEIDPRAQTQFAAANVSYTKAYGPEDVNWTPESIDRRSRDTRGFDRPKVARHVSMVR